MSTCLITGGTGTLGLQLIPIALKHFDRVRVLSRCEHRQADAEATIGSPNVDFILGDVRDLDRMLDAARDCSAVFHLAAFKSVDKAETDAQECKKTNVDGTENVIRACRVNRVARALFTSTDKAASPINIYGCSKMLAEREWILGNTGSWDTRFAAVRYGNVWGSTGSVISKWRKGESKLTSREMTRFFISKTDAAKFVWQAYENMQGGEVFIPKMKSTTMGNLYDWTVGGEPRMIEPRPGEKKHERLLSEDELEFVTDVNWAYARWPNHRLFPFEKWGPGIEAAPISNQVARFTQREVEEMWASM